MSKLLIFPCSTEVVLKNCNISGFITQISIKPKDSVSYQISYFNSNNENRSEWFYDFEFDVNIIQKQIIGFK